MAFQFVPGPPGPSHAVIKGRMPECLLNLPCHELVEGFNFTRQLTLVSLDVVQRSVSCMFMPSSPVVLAACAPQR